MPILSIYSPSTVNPTSQLRTLTSLTLHSRPPSPIKRPKSLTAPSIPPLDHSSLLPPSPTAKLRSSSYTTRSDANLTHLTPSGTAQMVSIASKPASHRVATAVGRVTFSSPDPARLIRTNQMKKGDVLAVARVAGIMAAKRTSEVVPLCHPVGISRVGVELVVVVPTEDKEVERGMEGGEKGHVRIQATVECVGSTGVEMEALMAVNGAALTVYDMCKAVDKRMEITGLRVVRKEGGRSGDWREEGWKGLNEE
ncbi:MAG: hypothetical protein Q9157_007374 [Trypethelium eluteriae]